MYLGTSVMCNFLSKALISRARPTLNLPCISPQSSVTYNGEYSRPGTKAQPSFHDVEVDGGHVEYLNKSFLRSNIQTDTPFAVDPLKKMACVISVYVETGHSAKLKIAKESNDLTDLAKVLPESYQKSNEFSVNRKCGQNVAAEDRGTFTGKYEVRRVYSWTAKVAFIRMKINVIVISLASIVIAELTFAMFLLKLSTLSAAIFLFVSLLLSLLFVYYIRMLCRHVCFV